MTPTINVNLKPCDMWCQSGPINARPASGHWGQCAAVPILIPCPIPRTVAFEVRLGECPQSCPGHLNSGHLHTPETIRVTCTIGGDTWAESEVTEVRTTGDVGQPWSEVLGRLMSACGQRWEIVKALVTGGSAWDYTMSRAKAVPLATITVLLAQRDAVFAALASVATTERARKAALIHAFEVVPGTANLSTESATWFTTADAFLAAYVSYLIAKVGAL